MGAMSSPGQRVGGDNARTIAAKPANPTRAPATPQQAGFESFALRHLNGGYGGWRRNRYPSGPGWSHAQVHRMARKRRNQARHKAASRRAKR